MGQKEKLIEQLKKVSKKKVILKEADDSELQILLINGMIENLNKLKTNLRDKNLIFRIQNGAKSLQVFD
jgi:hypothetical protein